MMKVGLLMIGSASAIRMEDGSSTAELTQSFRTGLDRLQTPFDDEMAKDAQALEFQKQLNVQAGEKIEKLQACLATVGELLEIAQRRKDDVESELESVAKCVKETPTDELIKKKDSLMGRVEMEQAYVQAVTDMMEKIQGEVDSAVLKLQENSRMIEEIEAAQREAGKRHEQLR